MAFEYFGVILQLLKTKLATGRHLNLSLKTPRKTQTHYCKLSNVQDLILKFSKYTLDILWEESPDDFHHFN